MDEEAIFTKALELESADQRSAYLDEACAGRAEVRRQIVGLLSAYVRSGDFLDRAAAAWNAHLPIHRDQHTMAQVGTVLGPYKLMEQIGEGGMGLVFVAEQQKPVRRKVALKLIKPGMDSKQVIARFEAERQALAMMDHPNIARILDAGTVGQAFQPDSLPDDAPPQSQAGKPDLHWGRPYFVMDLVKGLPITDYCDKNRLGTRQRLELFLDVCHAVQHAHQKGIIHRDLKPSNILVEVHDVRPVVKIIDFGISKAIGQQLTDKTLHTGIAQLIGTPLYMSPEQAGLSSLDVDTRSDVYSLGVLLYELLTGLTPFDGETLKKACYDEMRRIVREEEPSKPSTRLSTLGIGALSTISERRGADPRKLSYEVRGDLDWIVMKALEKDRNRRYESASALAADVQRYLQYEPVEACPPSALYRFRKFARRRKTALVAMAGVGVLTVTLAVLGGTIAWVAHDRAARDAETERAVGMAWEEADRWEKVGRWTDALAAAKRALDLLGERSGPDELRARARTRRNNLALLVRLDEVRLEMALARDDGGPTDLALGDKLYATAFREFGLDLDTLEPEEVARRLPQGIIREELAAALDDWAVLRRSARRRAKLANDRPWQRILDAARVADPHPDRNRARDLWAQFDAQASKEMRALPLDHLHPRSFRLLLQIGPGTSTRYLREFQRRLPGDFWLNYTLGRNLTLTMFNVSSNAPAQMDEASGFLRAALALRPDHPSVLADLGHALLQGTKPEQNMDEGVALLERAIRIKPELEMAHQYLGDGLARNGKLDEAAAAYRKAIGVKPDSVLGYLHLGDVLRRKGLWDEAGGAYTEAIRINSKAADVYLKMGYVMLRRGLFAESNKFYQAGLDLLPPADARRQSAQNSIKQNLRNLDEERRIPLILAGKDTAPANDILEMALMCVLFGEHYATAAFLYEKALAGDPRLMQEKTHRYNAACAAVLGGCGPSADKATFSDEQRTHLRLQARSWLAAELDLALAMLSDASIEKRLVAWDRLAHWQEDRRLAGVREPGALARLPTEEGKSWRQFWASIPNMRETRLEGILTSDDRTKVHEMPLAMGRTYVVDLESKAFDTFLRLDDSQGAKLAENDDANPNTTNSRVIFTPKEAGTYRVIASSFQNQGTGAYRLRIREFSDKPLP